MQLLDEVQVGITFPAYKSLSATGLGKSSEAYGFDGYSCKLTNEVGNEPH